MSMDSALQVGLIGFGTVGAGMAQTLIHNAERIAAMAGRPIRLVAIADVDLSRDRGVDTTGIRTTHDAGELLNDPTIDVIVELVGGTGVARQFVETALRNGKHVVTANKALLAQHGAELFALAAEKGLAIGLEGAVAGGIPLIQTLDGALAATQVREIYGIINGTCNYILTGIEHGEGTFEEVLRKAQEKGYAEADPTFDVEGIDAAHKITILASLCFGTQVAFDDVYTEGIRRISPEDLEYAAELGYRVKLLAIAKDLGDKVEVRVHPTMVPVSHLLASVSGVYNAVCLISEGMGTTLLYGRGAGSLPTGQAVASDLIQIARQLGRPRRAGCADAFLRRSKTVQPMAQVQTAYYIRLHVVDRPGVLARIASALGNCDISIASVIQQERREVGDVVPLAIMTHTAMEGNLQRALREITGYDSTRGEPFVIRVERLAPGS